MIFASKTKRNAESPKWIFSWRAPRSAAVFPAISLLLPAGLFAVVMTSLRVRVETPDPWLAQNASIILATQTPGGLDLIRFAKEDGPFPAPLEWEDSVTLPDGQDSFLRALRGSPKAWKPELKPLPESGVFPSVSLAEKKEMVFAPLPSARRKVNFPPVTTAPQLVALGGISSEEFPAELPRLDLPVDQTLLSETWRFLVRLRADGSVIDAISLAGGDPDGSDRTARLVNWLRNVRFAGGKDRPEERFAGVGLRFINHSTHGPEPR